MCERTGGACFCGVIEECEMTETSIVRETLAVVKGARRGRTVVGRTLSSWIRGVQGTMIQTRELVEMRRGAGQLKQREVLENRNDIAGDEGDGDVDLHDNKLSRC
jgi:hypothetical protein